MPQTDLQGPAELEPDMNADPGLSIQLQLDNATPALATSVRVMLEGKVGPGYWMGFGFNDPNLTQVRRLHHVHGGYCPLKQVMLAVGHASLAERLLHSSLHLMQQYT